MYRDKKIAVIVPAYNEEQHITKVLEGMPPFVDAVYVIDDGSTDGTAQIVQRFIVRSGGAAYAREGADRPLPWVRLISHPVNGGVGAAIVTGYMRCLADGMEIAAVMAGDNQMEPELLPAVLDPVVDGRAAYSKGTRLKNTEHLKGMSHWRQSGNFILRWLTMISSGNSCVTDSQNGYTAISREALESLDLGAVYTYYGYCNDLIVRLSVQHWPIIEIPMPSVYRDEVSKIRYREYIPRVSWLLLRLFLKRITGQLSGDRLAGPAPGSVRGPVNAHELQSRCQALERKPAMPQGSAR